MEWIKDKTSLSKDARVPIKSWCPDPEPEAMEQATNLASHPSVASHVALMPDCHVGYGMPIGGVIACDNAVIPNAVGVDIGCGMGAIRTTAAIADVPDLATIRAILAAIKLQVPVGEGHCHTTQQEWDGFAAFEAKVAGHEPEWLNESGLNRDRKNLGTLGGGNHFIELQASVEKRSSHGDASPAKAPGESLRELRRNGKKGEKGRRAMPDQDGQVPGGMAMGDAETGDSKLLQGLDEVAEGELWLMLHSGSRNLGHRVASFYHALARQLNEKWHTLIPSPDLAFLPVDSDEGQAYIRDMNFALAYARENRRKMMAVFKEVLAAHIPGLRFIEEINIHHNYAAIEHHFGKNLWVHRKGATSAKAGELGIIPGSMGASSFIVRGRGNPDSFGSCSHGAGRKMGRTEASRQLTLEECNQAMEGIVFDRWSRNQGLRNRKKKGTEYDFGEAPQAYKDINKVIANQLDLIEPLVKLRPLGVIKG